MPDKANTSRWLHAAALIAIPSIIFLYFFNWQILIATRTGWLLQSDWGGHLLGWNAFRHDRWRWPLGFTKLLAWPTGVPMTFTDSNPLMCLLLKPFAGVLPSPFQFTGPWLFACVLLQFASGYLVLGHGTQSRSLRLIGATLLTLVPTFIDRMPHPDLMAHWTILLSLHAFLNVERASRRDIWFAGLLVISALTHPYFLPMNGAIWACDLLRRLVRREYESLALLGLRAAGVALAPVAALWAMGGIGADRYETSKGGFGYYSMPLDGLFNPSVPGYSRLLPVGAVGPGQAFEGFQYLGAGLLALVLAACIVALRPPSPSHPRTREAWVLWLAPALVALTALALSDKIQLHGQVIAHLPLDRAPFHLTDSFRSSGRMFWPCTYVLLIAALEQIYTLPYPWPRGLCVAALALQIVDLTGFTRIERANTAAAAEPAFWRRTPSPQWDRWVGQAAVVEFQAPDPLIDGLAFYEIAWRATSAGRPVNIMYTSRVSLAQQAFEDQSRRRFLAGDLDPTHLYVIVDGHAPAGLAPGRMMQVDGLLVIPPTNGAIGGNAPKP